MKRIVFAVAICFAALAAQAQSLNNASDVTSNSGASNQGVNTTFNSYGTPQQVITSDGTTHLHTNQAQAVPPSFSSQSSVQTCSAAGAGVAVQAAGFGISGAAGTGMDPGCDLVRDLNVMGSLGATADEKLVRACMKPEVKMAMKAKCEAVATKQADTGARPQAILNGAAVSTDKEDIVGLNDADHDRQEAWQEARNTHKK